MTLTIHPEAVELVRRSIQLAGRDVGEVGVRIREIGGQLMPRFVSQAQPGDLVLEVDGVRVFVDQRVVQAHPRREIAVSEEHERLVLRDR